MSTPWTALALLGLTGCVGDWCDRFGLDCEEAPAEHVVVDEDGDVWIADEDCDDTNPDVYPGAYETCNGVDDDCDGLIDEGTPGGQAWYPDIDGDSFGDMAAAGLTTCEPTADYVLDHTDCDDTDADIHPGRTELCDEVDNDCDGLVDDEDDSILFAASDPNAWVDADGDGWGDETLGRQRVCELSEGQVEQGQDCDDTDPDVHPMAIETWYDGVDQNCDGRNDFDADGDGYPATDDDCDDTDPSVKPGATEVCDGVDNDCDGLADTCLELSDVGWSLAGSTRYSETGAALATGGDVDGDGLDDLLVGAPGEARAWLVTGPVTGDTDLTTMDSLSLDTGGVTLGASLVIMPDVDGDDYDDLIVADTTTSLRWRDGGAVWLVHGPVTTSLTLTEDDMWFPGAWKGRLGSQMAIGDVNGDALQDIVIGEPDQSYDVGRAFLILGPLDGDRIELTHSDPDLLHLGETVATGGDLTGDGVDDIVLGATTVYDSSTGTYHPQAFVLEGPVTANLDISEALANIQIDDGTSHQAISVAIAPDLDGDAVDDLVISFPCRYTSHSNLWVFSGTPTGQVLVDDDAVAKVPLATSSDYNNLATHQAVLGAGDLDGDGYGDLLVGDPYGGADEQGVVGRFAGPLSGVLDIVMDSVALYGTSADAHVGKSLAIGGGVLPDDDALFIGAPGSRASATWAVPVDALE